MMIVIKTDHLDYNPKTKTFCEEISTLESFYKMKISNPTPNSIFVLNPSTGNSKLFVYEGKDTDGSGEDIYGWRYINKETGLKLLLIND